MMGCFLEHIRDCSVRASDRGGELPGARLRIVEELGEARVNLRPSRGIGELQRSCRKKWVGEVDPITLELDDACGTSRVEPGRSVDTGCRLRDRDRRLSVCGRRDQKVTAGGRQREQPVVDEITERVRHGQWPSGLDGHTGTRQRSHDLERVEGIAACGLMHLREERAG